MTEREKEREVHDGWMMDGGWTDGWTDSSMLYASITEFYASINLNFGNLKN